MGHAIRSKILADYLKEKDHEILFVCGGKAYKYLSKHFDNVESIISMRFIHKDNRILQLPTIVNTVIKMITKVPFSYFKVKKIMKNFKPDIIITDADPISHYAGKTSKIKTVCIDNVQSMFFVKYKRSLNNIIPNLFLSIAMRIGMYNSDKYLVYHFLSKPKLKDKKVKLLPPLIQEGIRKQKPTEGKHIFVYQTYNTSNICEKLKKIDEKFIIYGFDKSEKDGNITYKKFNENDFYKDLSSAKAVIANGGFTLLSESIYLKKPIFSIPIENQFEQVFNGNFIEKLNIGEQHIKFSKKEFKNFLEKIDVYRKNLNSFDNYENIKIFSIIENELKNICKYKKDLYNIKLILNKEH